MDLTIFENKIFYTLFLIASGHSIFLSVLLLTKSIKEKGLEWLGIMMIPTSLWLLNYFFYLSDMIRSHPNLLGVFVPLLYLIGPAYYLFIKQATSEEKSLSWVDLIHLIPIVFVTWEWLPIYGMPVENKLAIIEHAYSIYKPTWVELLVGSRNELLILFYVFFSYKFLYRQIKHNLIYQDRIVWLMNFCKSFGAIILTKTLVLFLFWGLDWPGAVLELIMLLLLATVIHVLGYVVLGKSVVLPKMIKAGGYNQKYATSPLDHEQINNYKSQVSEYFDQEHPWLNADFSVNDLVSALNIPRHHISQVLNEGFKKGFYDINCEHRIREVKRLLLTNEASKFSIQGIAENCGFKSKSSFHRAFKKETGMTPRDYIKSSKVVEAKL